MFFCPSRGTTPQEKIERNIDKHLVLLNKKVIRNILATFLFLADYVFLRLRIHNLFSNINLVHNC